MAYRPVYNPRKRYQARQRSRMSLTVRIMLALGFALIAGAWLGRQYAASQLVSLRYEVEAQADELVELQDELNEVRADAQTANALYEQLKDDMSRELPEEGPLRELVAQLRQRLKEGIAPERLAFIIKSSRPPTNCTDPETKRFVASIPDMTGPDSTVSIGEGAVIVTGKGRPARDASGAPESWYDPAQPVTLSFKTQSGAQYSKKGSLPLNYSLIEGAREYRFTVEEGARSFIKVIYDSCDYP